MSSIPMWDGFQEAWEDCKSRNKHLMLITNYMESVEGREALNLEKANKILSIGAGTGELEYEMMNLCPYLKEMTLLDANYHQYKALEERFQSEQTVKVICQNMPFESYEGPKEGFDIVFCCQVFYHFPDMERQFDRALSLVRKGGKLVLVIDQYNNIESVLARNIRINEEYGVYNKLKELFIKKKLNYKEKELPNEYCFKDLGKKETFDLIDVFSNKPVTYQEKMCVIDELEKFFAPGTKTVKIATSVFTVNRE